MQVAYYLDVRNAQYLWMLKKSIKRTRKLMPGSEIILCTIEGFEELEMGIDRYVRIEAQKDSFTGYRKSLAFSQIEGECLCMDVDCFLQMDVRHVFNAPFDICLALRYRSKLVEKLPFNSGVAFTRSQDFWKEVAGEPSDHKDYFDIERRFCAVALNDKYFLRVLNGHVYNYSPDVENENLEGKAIVHYKGTRKNWAEAA